MTTGKIEELLNNPGIVRNRLKIPAVIHNAKLALEVRKEFGSFSDYIWSFSKGKTMHNHWKTWQEIPATSASFRCHEQGYDQKGI